MGEKELDRRIDETLGFANGVARAVRASWNTDFGNDWTSNHADIAELVVDMIRGRLALIAEDHPEVYEVDRLIEIAKWANDHVWDIIDEDSEDPVHIDERETLVSYSQLAPPEIVRPQMEERRANLRARKAEAQKNQSDSR